MYLNAEEVAIKSIVFPGKISQGSLNVSFFFSFFMIDKILNSASFVITDCQCETYTET